MRFPRRVLDLLLQNLAACLLAFTAVWALSVALRDASIVDVFWGPSFVLLAWLAFASTPAPTPRAGLVALLTTLWGARLGLYLLWRNAGAGEDYRYAAMRRRHGARFAWVSLGSVYALQAVLAFVVSLPVQAAIHAPAPPALGAPTSARASSISPKWVKPWVRHTVPRATMPGISPRGFTMMVLPSTASRSGRARNSSVLAHTFAT